MEPLLVLLIVGIVLLVAARLAGKIVEAVIGAVAIIAILYAILKYFALI